MSTRERASPADGPERRVIDLSTDRYYQEHASEYFAVTAHADLSPLYDAFLNELPARARILDAGCGSGRDLKVFVARGHDAVGIDASEALVTLAQQFSGAPCSVGRLEAMQYDQQFDGVWACASLLHLPRSELVPVLGRLRRALVHGGTLLLTLKEGSGEERIPDGRVYVYHAMDAVCESVKVAGFGLQQAWRTGGGPEGGRIQWLNVLARAR